MTAKDEASTRRRPKQARSRATWEAIVEAAAQVLERRGAEGFNTNAVAERAGVSIGTLYQYFADKQALLVAAARRELARSPDAGAVAATRRRALIEALIATLERLAGLGAGATAATRSTARTSPSRGDPGFERKAVELAWVWLGALVLAPRPALVPIPIRRREPRR
ncbi:MAG TPA: helix-turn-helix domain-containing protein [Caulobacteraceae bacterium]|nr:helix-turn-helix domain-containing protein [Caulobacteraceae bacterium]